MHRTQIYLAEDEWSALRIAANDTNSTMSALIRTAVRKLYLRGRHVGFDRALSSIAGVWKDRDFDTESHIRSMRRGTRTRSR